MRQIAAVLISASLLGQNPQLSDAARALVQEPRVGYAQLTLTSGQIRTGRILRVTDEFFVFTPNPDPKPHACENVGLFQIAEVRWLHRQYKQSAGARAAEVAYGSTVLSPFLAASAIKSSLQRISPPLEPLDGDWATSGHKTLPSSFRFDGKTVDYHTTNIKHGRWLLENNRLRLEMEGEVAVTTAFHFDCEKLVLEEPTRSLFALSGAPTRAPIVATWVDKGYKLELNPDGSAIRQTWETREGRFENTRTMLRIKWNDSNGPGGSEWVAEIKHRRILLNIGGVLTKYHFVPPGFVTDL